MIEDPDYQFCDEYLTIKINNEDDLLEDFWGIKLTPKESVFRMKDFLIPNKAEINLGNG